MSLARLALRLAAVEALCPAAALAASPAGPFPTVAGDRVYDSRIDLIAAAEGTDDLAAALAEIENKPILVVYTEEQGTTPYGEVKYPAGEEIVTLVIEAMIASRRNDAGRAAGWLDPDRRHDPGADYRSPA